MNNSEKLMAELLGSRAARQAAQMEEKRRAAEEREWWPRWRAVLDALPDQGKALRARMRQSSPLLEGNYPFGQMDNYLLEDRDDESHILISACLHELEKQVAQSASAEENADVLKFRRDVG